jgi:hypothetical protein
MVDIKLNARLSVYSKVSIKDMIDNGDIIIDAQRDDKLYGRRNGK